MKTGDFVVYTPPRPSFLKIEWLKRIGKRGQIIQCFSDRVEVVFDDEPNTSFKIFRNRLKLASRIKGHHLTNIFK